MPEKPHMDQPHAPASSELQKKEALLRAAFNASQEIISISNIFGDFVEVNQTFCEACGRKPEELIGTSGEAYSVWADLAKREEFLEILGKNGSVSGFVADLKRADGEVRTGLLSAKVVKVNGTPHIVTFARDISNLCK